MLLGAAAAAIVLRPQGVRLPHAQVQLLRLLRPHRCGLQGVQRVLPARPQGGSMPRLLHQVQKAGWVVESGDICNSYQWVVLKTGVLVTVAAVPLSCVYLRSCMAAAGIGGVESAALCLNTRLA
jgi:hypothetical protein